MSRALALVAPLLLTAWAGALAASCGGEGQIGGGGGAAPPLGPGYGGQAQNTGDLRVLSRDDCMSLRDHMIDISVAQALGDAGSDEGMRLKVDADLRARMKTDMDAWVKRCSGRAVQAKDLRCMREATTPKTFLDCGSAEADAGVVDAPAG